MFTRDVLVDWSYSGFSKIGGPANHSTLIIYSSKPTIFGGSRFEETPLWLIDEPPLMFLYWLEAVSLDG